jgi:HEAT repeat protein
VKEPALLPRLVADMALVATRSAALEALAAYGDLILPQVEAALAEAAPSDNERRLVRLCGQVRSEAVCALMGRHLDHPAPAMRDQILAVLSACAFRAMGAGEPAVTAVLRREVEQWLRLLVAEEAVADGEATRPLQRALAGEREQARHRAFLLLSFVYEAGAVLRAEFHLNQGGGAEQALALEMLDVTLSAGHKALMLPLVDPRLAPAQRIEQLARALDAPLPAGDLSRDERLGDLIYGAGAAWTQPWTRACAIYAAAQLGASQAAGQVERAVADPDPTVRETAAWSLNSLTPERFVLIYDRLLADSDPVVARLAARLMDET